MSTTPARPKRNQVAKACTWCRVHRIKCNSGYPCDNCKTRGGLCDNNNNNSSSSEVRTLPHAIREIESLRFQVKDLQGQLSDQSRLVESGGASSLPSPPLSSVAAGPPGYFTSLAEHATNKKYWEGIQTRFTQSDQNQCYGPSSLLYFISRMTSYLATALQEPHHEHYMQLNSACKSFSSPTRPRGKDFHDSIIPIESALMGGENLTEVQADYFLGLFWQSYHCIYHILDEAEFREHYRSLWTTSGAPRKPSALVDIVLAVCMQYGVGFLPRSHANADPKADVDDHDASIAGRWLYQRCQSLLAEKLESPSITTIQCYIFSVIYLYNASFQNTAHGILALAVRTAQTLGLHLEPPDDMPRVQRETRKRLWWTLYALDSQECMALGRPWATQVSHVTCIFPADDQELAMLSGAHSASVGSGMSVTCLTFALQNTKLILAARTVYTAFYAKCAEVLSSNNGRGLYGNPESLETCAGFLQSSMHCLQTWLTELPDALKTQRKGNGTPLSTDRSDVDVEPFAPLWLQRQRLLLELRYHTLSMNLYRSFIDFAPPSSSRPQPLAEANSISCLNHAMALTQLIRQVLTEMDILAGWYEAFRWQWNAVLSTLGFMLAHPVHPCTPAARRAVASAIVVFEIFGENFAVASSAAVVARSVAAKADALVNRFCTGAGSGSRSRSTPLPPLSSTTSLPESSAVETSSNSMQVFTASPETQDNWQFGGVSSMVTQFGGVDGASMDGIDESAMLMTWGLTDLESFSRLKPMGETSGSTMDLWGLM